MVANALADIAEWYSPMIDGAQQVGEAFLSWFDGIDVIGGLQSAFEGLAEFSQAWGELMLSVYGAVIEIVGELGSLIGDGLNAALGMVGVTGEQVGAGLGSVFDWLIDAVKAVAAAIRNWDLSLQYAWIEIQNFGENAAEVLGAFIENARIVFANFPEFASAAFGAVLQIMENLGTNISNLAGSIGDYMGEILSGNLSADFNVDFKPVMEGVAEQLAGLPDLVSAQTKTARERFGAEMSALDAEWNKREDARQSRIDQRATESRKAVAEAAGLNKGETKADDPRKAVAKKGEGADGKKEKAVAITDVAAFWEKLQGAGAKAGEKKAEQQREKQLQKADKTNQLLEKIADTGLGAVLS